MALGDTIGQIKALVGDVTPKQIAVGIGTAAAIGALGIGTRAIISRQRKRRGKRKAVRKRARKGQRQPYTAGKRKDTSTRRIRYTKNNQPYVILRSGKARFISKRSARLSRKRKGGTY